MKTLLSIAGGLAALFCVLRPDDALAEAPVLVFLVRHAETEETAKRLLSPAGRARAAALTDVLGQAGVTHLFSTDYPRTRGTVAPLAAALGLPVQTSARRARAQAARLRALASGDVAVVVGHSNTLPQLVREFGVKMQGLRRGLMGGGSHDQLHVLAFAPGGAARLVQMRYGGPSRQGQGGRAAEKVDPKDVLIGAAKGDRKSSSTFFYTQEGGFKVFGQFELTYGDPVWKPAYTKQVQAAPAGTRFRLGSNFFATFDTSCAVDLGGAQLAPGGYYLALEKGEGNAVFLVFLDPTEIRRNKRNSNQTADTKGGKKVRLEWGKLTGEKERLELELRPKARKGDTVHFVVRFGTHELQADLRAAF